MFGRLGRSTRFGRDVVAAATGAQITFLSAAVAYYAFVSLIPFLAVALVVAATLGGETTVEWLLGRTDAFLTDETQALLTEALLAGVGRVGATAVGSLVVAWGALKVFRAIDTAFSQVYGTTGEKGFIAGIRDGSLVLIAIGVGAAAMTAIRVGVRVLPLGQFAPAVGDIVAIATLGVCFFPMFYVFPGVPMSPRDALPGVGLTAVGWTALGSIFSVYVSVAGGVTLYGPIGGVLLLVTLLYLGALIVMLGAVVNAVAADRHLLQAGGRHTERMTDEREDGDVAAHAGNTGDAADAVDGPVEEDEPDDRDVGGAADEFDPPSSDDREERAAAREDVPEDVRQELRELRSELEAFEEEVEGRTVARDEVERDLRRYVRRRMRRGKARGWGPYLVLLYGTIMTLGAFYLLGGWVSIAAMIVVWLSTLGLYVLMVLAGAGLHLLGAPGRLRDAVGDWRS